MPGVSAYRGGTNLTQLHQILEANILLRRLKQDVLSQLPAKLRQKIPVTLDSEHVKVGRHCYFCDVDLLINGIVEPEGVQTSMLGQSGCAF